ncbi:hypothetical protein ABZX38_32960 [Streptomyces longwoodensis]|uniref:hypothetical protein n=1 Tax=Streptomyces longwoodensis TaxID=68231 RepID=UPI0033AB8EF3
MVAVTLVGLVIGALVGTGWGATQGTVNLADSFDPIGKGGILGALAGGAVGSGVLAVGAFFKGFRRKLVVTKGAGVCLGYLAALGICSVSIGIGVLAFGWDNWSGWEHRSLAGHLFELIAGGVFVGVVAGTALGLLVGALTVLCLAAIVLARLSAGFVHAARKSPEPGSPFLIDDACDPWLIRTAAALMPPEASRRWRDDFNEARYDYEQDQHARLLRDFLVHAPAVMVWAWVRHVLNVEKLKERRW